jgi:hypothetical protein
MIGAHQSSPYIIFTILGFGSTVFTEGSSMTWKNTSGGITAFLAAASTNLSASLFFVLSMYWTVNPLKNLSILRTGARCLSKV